MSKRQSAEERRNRYLLDDVTAMLKDQKQEYDRPMSDRELAHDLITVIRERVLEEVASAVRERTRK